MGKPGYLKSKFMDMLTSSVISKTHLVSDFVSGYRLDCESFSPLFWWERRFILRREGEG